MTVGYAAADFMTLFSRSKPPLRQKTSVTELS